MPAGATLLGSDTVKKNLGHKATPWGRPCMNLIFAEVSLPCLVVATSLVIVVVVIVVVLVVVVVKGTNCILVGVQTNAGYIRAKHA